MLAVCDVTRSLCIAAECRCISRVMVVWMEQRLVPRRFKSKQCLKLKSKVLQNILHTALIISFFSVTNTNMEHVWRKWASVVTARATCSELCVTFEHTLQSTQIWSNLTTRETMLIISAQFRKFSSLSFSASAVYCVQRSSTSLTNPKTWAHQSADPHRSRACVGFWDGFHAAGVAQVHTCKLCSCPSSGLKFLFGSIHHRSPWLDSDRLVFRYNLVLLTCVVVVIATWPSVPWWNWYVTWIPQKRWTSLLLLCLLPVTDTIKEIWFERYCYLMTAG